MVLGGPAPVLVTLIAQVTLVGVGVSQVPFDGKVDGRLGDFAEGRHQTVDQGDDEQEPQESR